MADKRESSNILVIDSVLVILGPFFPLLAALRGSSSESSLLSHGTLSANISVKTEQFRTKYSFLCGHAM
jgi:hypothetical protein